jgi:ribosomal protein L34
MRNPMGASLRSDNSTGFKGVTKHRKRAGFEARVQTQSGRGDARRCVSVWRETFPTAEDAARAYDESVRILHGSEEARFNFPRVGERGLDGVRRLA